MIIFLSFILFFLSLSFSALTALNIFEDYRGRMPSETVQKTSRIMLVFCGFAWALFYLSFIALRSYSLI